MKKIKGISKGRRTAISNGHGQTRDRTFRRRCPRLLHPVTDLFDLREVVLRVSVEDHLSDPDARIVLLAHRLGEVENIEFVFVAVGQRDELRLHVPLGRLPRGDVVEQVARRVVRVGALEPRGLSRRQILLAGARAIVQLGPEGLAGGVDEFVRVRRKTVHAAETVRGAAVAEKKHELVDRFGVLRAEKRAARRSENRGPTDRQSK